MHDWLAPFDRKTVSDVLADAYLSRFLVYTILIVLLTTRHKLVSATYDT